MATLVVLPADKQVGPRIINADRITFIADTSSDENEWEPSCRIFFGKKHFEDVNLSIQALGDLLGIEIPGAD